MPKKYIEYTSVEEAHQKGFDAEEKRIPGRKERQDMAHAMDPIKYPESSELPIAGTVKVGNGKIELEIESWQLPLFDEGDQGRASDISLTENEQ